MQYTFNYQSPLGGITAAGDGKHLTGLWFDGQKYFADTLSRDHTEKLLPVFEDTKKWLDIYFTGEEPNFTPPLYLSASPFRMVVWELLKQIPYGKTISYGDIAMKLAEQKGIDKMSAQAVGGAVGHNPISIIVPCHRVVGTNGSLTGYAGGIAKKIALLTLEKVAMESLFVPKKGTAL